MAKIMINVKIPVSQLKLLEVIQTTNGLTLSQVLSQGLKEFEYEGVVDDAEAKESIRLYVQPLEKRQLENLSRKNKSSIASIVRGVLQQALFKLGQA